ncbi:MAG TPA: aminotransferase class I/II-fold pyridoxal phosphate-dependent enzyme [Bryobacteraceae bacterium]|nr:aminotransferase class I/II-fold pyridoxal phosphate-dependent enzyme [Bryobacteraceae bacterium]
MSSPYMQWAKQRSGARFNLAASGLVAYPFSGLPIKLEDLDPLNRGGGYGYAPLQQAIARHCGVAEENVVSALGTSMANYLAMAAILEPGDEVLVEHPTYELLLSALGHLQADIRRFPRHAASGFALEPDEVARAITSRTRLIVIANLQNPSSAYASETELRAIGDIARRVGARVLVDEVYLEAAFDLSPRSAVHLGPEFVVTNSLTKVYGLSGLRCGWILADADLVRRIWLLNDLFEVNAAHPAERLSVIAFQNIERVRERSRALLDANRPLLNQFLASRNDLESRPLERGTVAFPRLLTGPVDRFCELFRSKYDGTVVPGSFFEMPDHFRIGIPIETAALQQNLERLSAALDDFRA